MSSPALSQFQRSMQIGYEQWHDGIGYDLDALDQLDDEEKRDAERLLIPRAGEDWRDLEALDRLNTPKAIQAILDVRKEGRTQEIRLKAHQVGPEPSEREWEAAILDSLETAEIYTGLTTALSCAIDHPSEAITAKLWQKVRDPESGVAYHCAAALCCMQGKLDSVWDDKYRPLFLRLVAQDSEDRRAALAELEAILAKGK